MNKLAINYLLLAIPALLSWWLVELTSEAETTRLAVPLHSEDFFSIGYTKIEMDDQGRLKNQLVADKMAHFSDDNTTELTNPVMTFYKTDAPPWVVHSEAGLISADYEDLFLKGKVFIERKAAPGYQLIQVNTSNLRVKPEESFAETDDWVELITPSDWVSGTGMKVFFKDSVTLELFSNVRSRYETL